MKTRRNAPESTIEQDEGPVGPASVRRSTGVGLAAALLLVCAGCDDGRTMLGTDSGTPPWDGESDTDAGPGPLASNRFPDVPLVNVGHESWNVVSFEAMNIVVNDTGSLTEALVVIRNNDPVVALCSVSGTIGLLDANGAGLGSFFVSYDSRVMQIYDIVLTCIPPGGIGLGYGNASGAARLEAVAEIQYQFNGSGYEGVVPYGDVRNENMEIVDPYGDGSYWVVSGTLRVVSDTILNPSFTVFPKVGGRPIDKLSDINLGTYGPGRRIDYRTTSAQTMFSDFWSALDYRAPNAVHADTPEVRQVLVDRELRQRIRDENEARRLHRF